MNKGFMKYALDQAKIAFNNYEVPVGAIIIHDGNIISRTHNMSKKICDPTAHAEILAIQQASKILNSDNLSSCQIYVTLEPCLMCATAISLAKISKVYYGLSDKKFGAYENESLIYSKNKSYHRPEVYSGFCESEIEGLMKDFFKKLRFEKK